MRIVSDRLRFAQGHREIPSNRAGVYI